MKVISLHVDNKIPVTITCQTLKTSRPTLYRWLALKQSRQSAMTQTGESEIKTGKWLHFTFGVTGLNSLAVPMGMSGETRRTV